MRAVVGVALSAPTAAPSPRSEAMVILRTHELTFGFGGALVTDHVSLDVHEGEFLSIIGPNGAGKTTYFNLLTGMYRPASGSIYFRGRRITRMNAAQRAQIGISRSFQVSNLFPALSAYENVRLAAQARQAHRFQLLWPHSAFRHDTRRADSALDLVGLSRSASVPAVALSHGDKRKLELAMTIAQEPTVVLLDEPTAGVSAEDVPAMVDLIRHIREVERKTVVMIEHKIGVVRQLSDRIAVLHLGRLLVVGTPDAVRGNAAVQSAYLGKEEL